MNKSLVPPSGNKHDYASLDEYYWPCNCIAPDPLSPPNCSASAHMRGGGGGAAVDAHDANAAVGAHAAKPSPAPCDNATGLPYVRHDGFLDPLMASYDFLQFSALYNQSVTLALAYALSGNETYAAWGALLLRTWFIDSETKMEPNLAYAQIVPGVYPDGQHSGTIDGSCHLPYIYDAITLFAPSPHWTASDNASAIEWGGAYNRWLVNSSAGRNESEKEHNNHASWYIVGVASGSLWVGDVATAAHFIERARASVVGQQIALNGSLPAELARTRSAFYTDFDLHAMFAIAQMSAAAGVAPDLLHYSSPGNGTCVRAALDFLVPYAVRGEPWPFPQVSPYSFDSLYDLFLRAAAAWANETYAAWAQALPGDHATDVANLLWGGTGA